MPAPIYIPRRQNPWTNMMPGLLQNLVLQKIGQNMRLKEKEMDIKRITAEKAKAVEYAAAESGRGVQRTDAEKPKEGWVQNPYDPTSYIEPTGGIELVPLEGMPGMFGKVQNGRVVEIIKGHKPAEGPYKEGALKEFKEGDQIIMKEFRGGQWVNTDSVAPRYKPASTSLSVGPEGGVNFYSGPNAQVTPMSPTKTTQNKIQDDIITLDDTINVMGDAIKASDPKFQELGTIFSNALTGWKAKSKGVPVLSDILGTVSPEEASALSAFADYRNKWANSIIPRMRKMAGANFTKIEQKMYYQMLPKTGTGIFDGDDPITFQKKAKNAYEMNLKERARRKFYMSSGKSYDDYKKAVASGKIMSLDETMEMINRKGAEVEAQLRASGKGLSDEQIVMQVKTILKNLYGN
jgi:hypothetical protein